MTPDQIAPHRDVLSAFLARQQRRTLLVTLGAAGCYALAVYVWYLGHNLWAVALATVTFIAVRVWRVRHLKQALKGLEQDSPEAGRLLRQAFDEKGEAAALSELGVLLAATGDGHAQAPKD